MNSTLRVAYKLYIHGIIWEYARDKVFHSQSNGYSVELITTREARAVEPEISDSLPGVMFLPKRGRANPIKATLAFGRAASELKSVIKTNHEVQNITPTARLFMARQDKPRKFNMRYCSLGGRSLEPTSW
ncbi:MAG: hypothetical protein Ct9H300mP27_04640 [Chloroflexota bacterium]|nr:MAG: hypothetical protein Ct9H300mP27_04640 [Chloroflexota bacterium]